MASAGARLVLGLLPVLAFLLALILLDSYKLIRVRIVALLLVAGGMAAVASLFLNPLMADLLGLDGAALVRYLAPVTEELLKGAIVIALIARRRVGFLVD